MVDFYHCGLHWQYVVFAILLRVSHLSEFRPVAVSRGPCRLLTQWYQSSAFFSCFDICCSCIDKLLSRALF